MAESSSGAIRPGIDLHAPPNQANPFPIYAVLRDQYPVCQLEPDGLWAISRHDDVRYALEHPNLFSSAGFKTLIQPDWIREECKRDLFMVLDDPPEHTRRRALVSKGFSYRVIQELVPLMRQTSSSLLQDIRRGRSTEFLKHFAFPYVGTIIGHIVGTIDSQSLDELYGWVKLMGKNTPVRPDDEYIEALEAAILKQNAYFDDVILDRRAHPREDLVTQLMKAEVDGEKMTDRMLRNVLELLVGSGFHTTLHALCNSMIQLSERPDIASRLAGDFDLIPKFIEEILRHNTPVHYLFRQTTTDVTLSGVTIPAGAFVLVLLASANRDPACFPEPNIFDMSRQNLKQHLAFGCGPHLCIGANLALLEIKTALETILGISDRISCPPVDELEWNFSSMIRGVDSLPVTFN